MIALTACGVQDGGEAALEPQGRVTDLANLLGEEEQDFLEQTLAAYEAETCHQIAVLTVETLAGESIEAFSLRTANAWGIGHRGLDNGVLLTVATADAKIRIEVGLGLEETITDDAARRILDFVTLPHFRSQSFSEGIGASVVAIENLARGLAIPKADRPVICRDTGSEPESSR